MKRNNAYLYKQNLEEISVFSALLASGRRCVGQLACLSAW
ncbi:hypothetical protein ApDm4_1010 [Acetobacter pomorum]|nr:hypothetical protein ApDm4_1010 [Acetobacter pomorum]